MVLRFSRGRVGSRLFKVRSKGLTFFCVRMVRAADLGLRMECTFVRFREGRMETFSDRWEGSRLAGSTVRRTDAESGIVR